jgi:hypothetical protein
MQTPKCKKKIKKILVCCNISGKQKPLRVIMLEDPIFKDFHEMQLELYYFKR